MGPSPHMTPYPRDPFCLAPHKTQQIMNHCHAEAGKKLTHVTSSRRFLHGCCMTGKGLGLAVRIRLVPVTTTRNRSTMRALGFLFGLFSGVTPALKPKVCK